VLWFLFSRPRSHVLGVKTAISGSRFLIHRLTHPDWGSKTAISGPRCLLHRLTHPDFRRKSCDKGLDCCEKSTTGRHYDGHELSGSGPELEPAPPCTRHHQRCPDTPAGKGAQSRLNSGSRALLLQELAEASRHPGRSSQAGKGVQACQTGMVR
jgi:hypothetical protein